MASRAAIVPSDGIPRTSIIIPAYNEENRLPGTLWALRKGLAGSDYEIAVADDGSCDRTASIARDNGAILVRHGQNRGKGAALVSGMSTVSGEVLVFLDADLPCPVSEVRRMVTFITETGCDVVFGSRRASGASVSRPLLKKMAGRCYNLLARAMLGVELNDTQCGVKALTANAACMVLPMLTEKGFSIDMDLLLAARQTGLEVRELGIQWRDKPGSTVHLLRDTVRMAQALFRLRRKYSKVAVPEVAGVRA